MIYRNMFGFVSFQFESPQELAVVQKMMTIPNLIPDQMIPNVFYPREQMVPIALIQGQLAGTAPITTSHEVSALGFKVNSLCYDFITDGIVSQASIISKVELGVNQYQQRIANFIIQPYAICGFDGRAEAFEAQYDFQMGIWVFRFIKFQMGL